MTKKTFRLDADKPPKLSEIAKRHYDATKDKDIDYSEIPDMGDVDWERSSAKPTVTMRLDEDVISYFKKR